MQMLQDALTLYTSSGEPYRGFVFDGYTFWYLVFACASALGLLVAFARLTNTHSHSG